MVMALCLIVTPTSCQYVEREGPAWMKPLPKAQQESLGVQTTQNEAVFTSFTLAAFMFAGLAVACFVVPNLKD